MGLIDSRVVSNPTSGNSVYKDLNDHAASLADIVTLAPNGTDDTAQIQNALVNAQDGQRIRFRKGTGSYILKNTSTIICNKSVTIEVEEGALFDVTQATASPVLQFTGSLGTFTQLGADVTQGSLQVTLNSSLASSLSNGDIIYFTTDTNYGGSGEQWSTARTYYYKGEMAMVESVSGNVVTLSHPIWDGYTAVNTVVCKLNYINLEISKVRVKGDATKGQIGIAVNYAKYAKFDGGSIKGTSNACVQINYCYSFSVRNMFMSDFYKASLGLCYGVAVISSQNGLIEGNHIQGGRHAVTHGGTTPSRNVRTVNNPLLITSAAGNYDSVDSHENCEFIEIIDNTCSSISLGGRNLRANGNTIINNYKVNAPLISFDMTKTNGFVEAFGNKLYAFGANGNDGIEVKSSVGNVTINSVRIKDNDINVQRNGLSFRGETENVIMSILDLNSNDVVAGTAGITFVTGAALTNKLTVSNLKINKGRYRSTTNNLITFTSTPVFTNVEIRGAKFELPEAFRLGYFTSVTNYLFNDNDVEGVGSGYSLQFGNTNAANIVEVRRNRFKHMQSGGLFLNATKIFLSDNVNDDITGSPSLTGQLISQVTSSGNYVTYASATPTTGTWAKGDRCLNSSPAVGSPKAWVCTAAGTPGTWVSEGNL